MSTTLTFGEIADIEHSLVELGCKFAIGSIDGTLRAAAQWFASLEPTLQERIGADNFEKLASASRGHPSESMRHLCMGALALIQRDASAHLERARFVARFAAQRLGALGEPSMFCSSDEEAEAQALFEAAKGDHSYSEAQLVQSTEPFVREHLGKAGFYGRLAAGLNHLLGVLADEIATEQDRETARAALTYFVVTSDAIPDDLGLVGLLDDAVIVQHAVAEIHPERRDLAKILDGIVTHWPFVEALAFASEGDQYPLSEFVLVNSALLLSEILDERVTGAVVVVPEVGPLPLLCGFLRALAELRRTLDDQEELSFQPGNRLRNRANGAEVEFAGYFREAGPALLSCEAGEATHFQFRTDDSTLRTRKIKDLGLFALSARRTGTLKGGNKSFDRRSMAMGPLERLFGSIRPVSMPSARRRTIVVMDPFSARQLAADLSLFGTSLYDILTISGARVDRGGLSEETWTKEGPGGIPMLTVVRTAAEAWELVQAGDMPVAGVVARVRHGSTDALNLSMIHARGVPVVAFVAASDQESHQLLDGAGLPFWHWDERWFGALYWPGSTADHEIGSYERWLRGLKKADIRVESLHMPELDHAWANLKRLHLPATDEEGEDDDELLGVFICEALGLLHVIRARVTPVDANFLSMLSRRRTRLKTAAQSGFSWWRDEQSDAVRKVVDGLDGAIESLSRHNPKWRALTAWAAAHKDGAIICNRAIQAALTAAPLPRPIAFSTPASAFRLPAALVPAWINAERMDRLLNPPVASELHLLLYGPEREWYESARQRHERARRRLEQFASKRALFRALGPHTRRQPPEEPIVSSPISTSDPEKLQARATRAALLHGLRGDLVDPVDARLVHFAGGVWALFSAESRLRTVTHLLGSTDVAGQELLVKSAWDLEAGDLVVLVRGSDRDALRARVDDVVATGTRETAAEWQRALRRYLKNHPVEELVKKLADAGCRRHASTVSAWLRDDTMIRPRDGRLDVEAIARATGDAELVARLDDCIKCADELYAAHMRVGRQLVTQILEKVKSWIAIGVAPDEIVELDERIVLVTVEAVDDASLKVPRARLGRLESDA